MNNMKSVFRGTGSVVELFNHAHTASPGHRLVKAFNTSRAHASVTDSPGKPKTTHLAAWIDHKEIV